MGSAVIGPAMDTTAVLTGMECEDEIALSRAWSAWKRMALPTTFACAVKFSEE